MKKSKAKILKANRRSRLQVFAGGAFCVVAVTAISWGFGLFGNSEDPRVTEIKNLQQDLAKKFKPTQGPASCLLYTSPSPRD